MSPENKPHNLMLIYAFLTDETRAYDFNPGFLFAAIVAFHIKNNFKEEYKNVFVFDWEPCTISYS